MMHFRLVSAQGVKYDDEAYEVLVPTKAGTIAVFENHMPLISAAAGGVVSVRAKPSDRDAEMENFAVSGGVMQVDGKELVFLSDDITASDEVNEKEAEAARNLFIEGLARLAVEAAMLPSAIIIWATKSIA
jgi:ATP synthase F1 epsilon subunit